MVLDPHNPMTGEPETRRPCSSNHPSPRPCWIRGRHRSRTVLPSGVDEPANSNDSFTGAKLRAWAGRVSGRADRRLLFAIAHATDAIAAHCDLIADRLATQETITADISRAFGEEISQLRSEVIHLQRAWWGQPVPPHE